MADSRRIGLTAAGLAALLAMLTALHDSASMFGGDAGAYRAVARWPFGNGSALRALHVVANEGTAYRFGRIGAPLLAWLAALGHPGWVSVTFFIINVAAIGVAVGAGTELLRSRGVEAERALLLLVVPGLAMGMVSTNVEPVAIAAVLCAFVAYERGRFPLAVVLAAFAILSREVMVLAFVPLVMRDRRRAWVGALMPYGMWCMWLRLRMGSFPFTDPASTRRQALGFPGAGLLHALRVHDSGVRLGAILVVTIAVGSIVVALRYRHSLYGQVALALGVLAPFLGAQNYLFLSDTLRVLGPLHVFLLLAVLTSHSRMRTAPRDRLAATSADS